MEAISNIRALTTLNGDLSPEAFLLRPEKEKGKEKAGPRISFHVTGSSGELQNDQKHGIVRATILNLWGKG